MFRLLYCTICMAWHGKRGLADFQDRQMHIFLPLYIYIYFSFYRLELPEPRNRIVLVPTKPPWNARVGVELVRVLISIEVEHSSNLLEARKLIPRAAVARLRREVV